jgi:hypothetical protein
MVALWVSCVYHWCLSLRGKKTISHVQQETATRVKEACEHFNKASRDPLARKSSRLLKDFAGNHLVPGQGCCPLNHKTEQK